MNSNIVLILPQLVEEIVYQVGRLLKKTENMAGNMTLTGNSEFKSWVSQLKKDIRHAQVKAAIKVNTELLRLYWRMGADICEKQKSASWGDG